MAPRITRAGWGAKPVPPGRPTRVASTYGTAVHWVGPGTWGSKGPAGRHDLCAGKLRGIQRAHMAGQWYDVAYNEAVCPHGFRYELRGYHVQTGANGSAFANEHYYAILCLVGEGDPQPPEMIAALEDACEAYRLAGNAGPTMTTHRYLLKRYAGKSTACPGDRLAGMVESGRFDHKAPAPKPPAPAGPGRKVVTTMLVQVEGQDPVWVTDGMTRRHLASRQALDDYAAALRDAGAPATALTPYVVPSEKRAAAAFGPVKP